MFNERICVDKLTIPMIKLHLGLGVVLLMLTKELFSSESKCTNIRCSKSIQNSNNIKMTNIYTRTQLNYP